MGEDIIRMGRHVRTSQATGLRFLPRSDGDSACAEYAFPNDERERERLDMQHAMQSMLLNGKLFWSPIGPAPQKVLDLGTGTGSAFDASRDKYTVLTILRGIWAIDMADMYPSAEVTGGKLHIISID
jgi:hypothetical protein